MKNDIIPLKPQNSASKRLPQQSPGHLAQPQVSPQAQFGHQSFRPQPESRQAFTKAPADAAKVLGSEERAARPSQPTGKQRLPRMLWIILGVVALVIAVVVAAWLWYLSALSPVNSSDETRKHIVIEPGSSLSIVSQLLEDEELIRSQLAFNLHARAVGANTRLQAGDYRLSPSESTQEIMEHLTSGSVDEFTLTFLPGATLRRLPGETNEQRTDIKSAILGAGYSDAEIELAFEKTYDHPLLAGKPAGADLEGYIYGETYNFASNSSVEQILERTFDHYYKIIQENDLIEGLRKQNLTLYQGITLASVIQREVRSQADQKQVAQIFLDRLATGMSLGADATFEYAAKKDNVPATPQLDSPYNTRRFVGLPPGPIATPGLSALIAVAQPAPGDYLYFVSGDDGTNHFARTLEQHEANVRQYCSTLCFGG